MTHILLQITEGQVTPDQEVGPLHECKKGLKYINFGHCTPLYFVSAGQPVVQKYVNKKHIFDWDMK